MEQDSNKIRVIFLIFPKEGNEHSARCYLSLEHTEKLRDLLSKYIDDERFIPEF